MNKLVKVGALAGAVLMAAASNAFWDPEILIQRSVNTPNFTVKYTGASAAMVELRVNGTSVGTQNVSASKKSGEVVFALDLSLLSDGENDVEVRLFDKSGKLLGTQKSIITTDDETPSPVRLNNPRSGSTVQGQIDVKLGFGKEMRDVYVSFFVNNQFKAMTNTFPYNFLWDTAGEPNGWHDLEAWVVDANSVTWKTRKIRVFVNNPGGRTDRRVTTPTTVPSATPAVPTVTSAVPVKTTLIPKPIISNPVVNPAVSNAVKATNSTVTTAATSRIDLAPALNGISAVTSNAVGLKPARTLAPVTGNAKLALPNSNAPTKLNTKLDGVKAPTVTNVRATEAAVGTISITKGQRLPNLGAFTILLNSKVVEFDVQPRVEKGIPLTPIRHLLEEAGGSVDWEHLSKTLMAEAEGNRIVVKIGDKVASINDLPVELEYTPFLEKGRTIVPLSFIRDSLQVDIEFDRKTGHVLITSVKKTEKK